MKRLRISTLALTAAATVAVGAGCATSRVSDANTPKPPPSTAFTSSTLSAPAGSGQSACTKLGGAVQSDHNCRLHTATASYTLDFNFPLDYPDLHAVIDFLTHERDEYIGWAAKSPPRSYPYELNIIGMTYRSGTPASGTQSLVFNIGNDTGIHPVTTYQAFNYDLNTHLPITFDRLFKPGTQSLEVLKPIVQRELNKHDPAGGPLSLNDLGVQGYRSFAITDNTVLFFFDQDTLLPHEDGPLEVAVPRTELASVLA
jgi:hypothetical protein